jgi:hypothetical protein
MSGRTREFNTRVLTRANCLRLASVVNNGICLTAAARV